MLASSYPVLMSYPCSTAFRKYVHNGTNLAAPPYVAGIMPHFPPPRAGLPVCTYFRNRVVVSFFNPHRANNMRRSDIVLFFLFDHAQTPFFAQLHGQEGHFFIRAA